MTDHFDHDHDHDHDDDHDLDALRDLRADIAPPGADVLAAARARLREQDVRPAVLTMRPHRRRRPSPARRRALTGIAAAATVAAVATGAYVLTGDPVGRTPAARGPGTAIVTTPGSSTPGSNTPRVVRFVNAAQVLDAASAGAARASAPLPAGRYRHVSSHAFSVTQVDEPPANGAYELSENRSDTWTPTTGVAYERNDNNITVRYPTAEQRRYAKRSPGGIPQRELTWYEVRGERYTQVYPEYGQDPILVPCKNCPHSVWDSADSAAPSEFSRDRVALRRSLYAWAKGTYADLVKYGKGDQFTVDDLAYDALTKVATRTDVPGDLHAEIYQVIKTVPGITLINSLANYDGAKGVAVGRVDTFHVQHDLIFTGNGTTYIGDRTIARKPSREYEVKAGTLLGATAVTVEVTGKPEIPHR